MARVIDVARFIVERKGEMSAMKLQKLTYYSQAWHLAFEGEPLFPSEIEAWANGPVVPALYRAHRGQFRIESDAFSGATPELLTDAEKSTVLAVMEAYGEMTAHELSNLTHSERPWQEARRGIPEGQRCNAVIDTATMLEFYEELSRETAQ